MAKSKDQSPAKDVKPIPIEDQGAVPGMLSIPAQQQPMQLITQPQVPPAAAAFLSGAGPTAPPPPGIPIIQIDHKSAEFLLPSGECVPYIRGFPIYYFGTKKWYKDSPKPGDKGRAPDCYSINLKEPHPASVLKQHETCDGCPRNVFGSGKDGRSKDCKDMTWVFLANREFGSPPIGILIVPPSSISVLFGTKFKGGYFQQAAHRFGAYQIAWTEFTLSRAGDLHCVLVPKIVQGATEEQAGRLAELHKRFHDDMERMRGTVATVEDEAEQVEEKEAS